MPAAIPLDAPALPASDGSIDSFLADYQASAEQASTKAEHGELTFPITCLFLNTKNSCLQHTALL